jgi:DNA-binding transcriptional regulator GbsR (MarR family)
MEEIEKKFVEIFKEVGQHTGLDDLSATIYAILYLEPSAIPMEDLVMKTGYSLASISNKVRMLENIELIRRFRKPASKKVYLSMEKDIVTSVKRHIMKKEECEIRILKERLPDLLKDCRGRARADKDKQKIRLIEDYYAQMLKLEEILKDILSRIERG